MLSCSYIDEGTTYTTVKGIPRRDIEAVAQTPLQQPAPIDSFSTASVGTSIPHTENDACCSVAANQLVTRSIREGPAYKLPLFAVQDSQLRNKLPIDIRTAESSLQFLGYPHG